MNNEKEFKEMLLKNLSDNWFEYIAKDINGVLHAFKEKPFKSEYCWQIEYGCEEDIYNLNEFKSLFEKISWEDAEPFKINKPVDWSKVPVDTKVLVSDDGEYWQRAYFSEYNPRLLPNTPFLTFGCGATSWTAEEADRWEYCKLADGEE